MRSLPASALRHDMYWEIEKQTVVVQPVRIEVGEGNVNGEVGRPKLTGDVAPNVDGVLKQRLPVFAASFRRNNVAGVPVGFNPKTLGGLQKYTKKSQENNAHDG